MNYSIGLDIGGTTIAIGVVNELGEVIKESLLETDTSVPPSTMITRVNHQINNFIKGANITTEKILGIGVGAPGPLNSKEGYLINPPNLPGWDGFPLKQKIEQAFPYQVIMENDANAAALAEKWIGAGDNCNNFIYMTVSTGIGAGIISEGKLLHGRQGNAGDIGHTVVDPSFGKCKCGQYGCIEAIASGTAISNYASNMTGERLSTKDVFQLYDDGHHEIRQYIDHVFRLLGVLCVTLINTFDTERIIIGGGVSKVGDRLFHPVRAYVQKYALNSIGRDTEIVPAQLDQHAGIIGAASLCINI